MEDVQFLFDNSDRESYLFQADSGARDRLAWPTPSEYDIVFDSPFRFVVGLDVIDASIPRTQYSVDEHNNSLTISTNGGSPVTLRIAPGDHTDATITDELNSLLRDNYGIVVAPQSNPAALQNALKFTSNTPFYFDMERSTCQAVLGFNEYASNSRHKGIRFGCDDPVNHPQRFSSLSSEPTTLSTFIGASSADHYLDVANSLPYVAQRILATTSGILEEVSAAFKVQGRPVSDVVAWKIVDIDPVTGDPLGPALVGGTIHAIDYFVLGSVNEGRSTSGDVSGQEVNLTGGRYYWLVFHIPDENIGVYYGQEMMYGNILLSADSRLWTDVHPTLQAIIMGSCTCKVNVRRKVETLLAPGIMNLTGEPYIMLRIPEIESHMYRSRSFEKHSFGVAKFTLGVVGYANDRFDYASVPPRTFHPIGKLDRITLLFLTGSGKPYDFKGVDHQLIIVLRYLQPRQREKFNNRLLNPEYQPDDIARLKNMKSVDDTDSEDESDDIELGFDDNERADMEMLRAVEGGLYSMRYPQ